MKELELTEIKKIQLNILMHIDNYCREHDIQFFLSNGTLLGAVKYKGFIPWDDDIDVFVPREDFDRLIKEYPTSGKMKLLSTERDEHYVFPYAKLSDTSTMIQGQTALKECECGVHIDIFPLDYWNDSSDIAQKDARKNKALVCKLCLAMAQFGKGRTLLRTLVKNTVIICTRIRGASHYRRALEKQIKGCLCRSGNMARGCVVWPIYGEREIIPAEVFVKTVDVEFEGELFPAPAGYDTYLRSLYGDYEKDPPMDQQRSHHAYTAYSK